jgi:outer membrane protein assembly factor BamA
VAGADPFGAFLGGGTSFFWSDIFGEHNLATQVQVNGGYRDIAAIVGYENRAHRWNWGGVVEQIPYVTGFFSTALANDNGTPVYVEQEDKFRQTYRLASGVVTYPFSPVQRVEFSGGLSRISFDEEVDTAGYDAVTGTQLFRDVQHLPAPDAMNLLQSSAALVYDNSYFGATSPILGQRYRLEVRPTTGTIDFFNTLVDYRRYFMPFRPYTLATRIMHYGRYGSGAEDHRLLPLFLGYPNLVRGYDYNSFSANECVPNGDSGCPAFDRLMGSKIMVGNLELRFPIYGAFRHDGSFYGPLPLEAAIFADAGVAWANGERPSFFGGDRKPVASAGLALRANAFGFAIVEVDFVHPFNRPEKSWLWQFNFISGF